MTIGRANLKDWVYEAVKDLREDTPAMIAKHIWDRHEAELRAAGDLFYTWQYDTRWAAQALQKDGKLKKTGRTWMFVK